MNKSYLLSLSYLLVFTGVLVGQADSIYQLSSVTIQAERIRDNALGANSMHWDSDEIQEFASHSVADLLQQEGGVYIKGYGLGSLSTSSIRGGSAGHTLVLWNGLPLQSPMLGQLDLSLLPVGAAESIQLEKGGNTALWGSGAIGGLLSMENEGDFSNRLRMNTHTSVGSFGNFQQQVGIGIGNSVWQSRTQVFHQQAQNDFLYEIAKGIPKRRQTNAALSQQNLLQDLYWKPNDRNQFSLHIWRQESDREIPPTIVQNRSEARQEDRATRFVLEWEHEATVGHFHAKSGFFTESILYSDAQIGLVAPSEFKTCMGELVYQSRKPLAHTWMLGVTHSYTQAESNGYQEIQTENRSALFASWKWKEGKWGLQGSLRQGWIESEAVPLVPMIGLEYKLTPQVNFLAKVSRNYRLPTLNERFWVPGGNPEILPESGWSEEATLSGEFKRNLSNFSWSLTGFNRNINNWILWSIREGQSYWSANNITRVWSRGMEVRGMFATTWNAWKLNTRLGYDYIRSTNQVALENPRMLAGQQLLYTPEHQAFGKLSLAWQGLRMTYSHRFFGKARGINEPLPAFDVGTARIQYTSQIKSHPITLFFELNNAWNRSYFIVERRPMPGTQIQTGINLLFHKKTPS